MERIEKLFHELQYEICRGLTERDLGPEYLVGFSFMHPSPDDHDSVIIARFGMKELKRGHYALYAERMDSFNTVKTSKPEET